MKTTLKAQDQSNLKFNNTSVVLETIRRSKNISRSQIARTLKISPSSSTRIVGDLIKNDIIIETDVLLGKLGRKATQLKINKDNSYFIGFEITDKLINSCILDFSGMVIGKFQEDILFPAGPDSIIILLDMLKDIFNKLCTNSSVLTSKVLGIGVGIVGSVNPSTGESVYSDLLKWKNVPLKKILENLFLVPVVVDNDIKCAIKGEVFQPANNDLSDVTLLSFGRGVAAATIYKGELLRGSTNGAGEIGHTIVDFSDGKICYCGRKGCATAYLSEENIINFAMTNDKNIETLEDIQTALEKKELWAENLIEKISTYIAILISNVVCYQNPSNIILRGSLFEKIKSLREQVFLKCDYFQFYPLKNTTIFLEDILKQDAVCVGAAINALNNESIRKIRQIALS